MIDLEKLKKELNKKSRIGFSLLFDLIDLQKEIVVLEDEMEGLIQKHKLSGYRIRSSRKLIRKYCDKFCKIQMQKRAEDFTIKTSRRVMLNG